MAVSLHCSLSRRALLEGSAMAFVLILPSAAPGRARQVLPALVQLHWGPGQSAAAAPARLICAITAALADPLGGPGLAWVLADA